MIRVNATLLSITEQNELEIVLFSILQYFDITVIRLEFAGLMTSQPSWVI